MWIILENSFPIAFAETRGPNVCLITSLWWEDAWGGGIASQTSGMGWGISSASLAMPSWGSPIMHANSNWSFC